MQLILRKKGNTRKVSKILLTATLTVSILLILSILPFLPTAANVDNVFLLNNQAINLTTDPGFEQNNHWEHQTHGSAMVKYTYTDVGEGTRSLHIRSAGNTTSNTTLTYTGPKAAEFHKISPNLGLRFKMKLIDKVTDGSESYLAVTTFVVWKNQTLIPLRIVVGDFARESESVSSTGILIIRNQIESEKWTDYVYQMSKVVESAVQYLREKNTRAFVEDDFRTFGLAVYPVNVELLLDSVAFSLITPAQLTLEVRSNSFTPMDTLLTKIMLNGSQTIFNITRESTLPFTTFSVDAQIPRPLIQGEKHVFELQFSTGLSLKKTVTVENSAWWL